MPEPKKPTEAAKPLRGASPLDYEAFVAQLGREHQADLDAELDVHEAYKAGAHEKNFAPGEGFVPVFDPDAVFDPLPPPKHDAMRTWANKRQPPR